MSAKQDAEDLMNEWVVFAKRMLAEYGEFLPYGAAMKPSGEILSIAAHTGEEMPPSRDLIDLLNNCFRSGAVSGEYKATALFYDVTVQLPNSTEKSDAIAVSLEHQDDYSVVVFHPYIIVDEVPEYGTLSAMKGNNNIFK